jgi:hypothetical protein
MHVVSVRPQGRLMEEGADGIVKMRRVLVAKCAQGHRVLFERLQFRDGNLDVDDGLGRKAGHRSRPVVFNSKGDWPERGGYAVAFGGKRVRPRIDIRHNLESRHGPA